MTDQDAVISFLSDPASHNPRPDTVERIDTHGAHVFLAGVRAIKIKRAVRYSYLDFSTLERRRAAIEREYEINHPNAPEIYERVAPIVRDTHGRLHLSGVGEAVASGLAVARSARIVEWALVMRRFKQSDLLSRRVASPGLHSDEIKSLADAVLRSHQTARVAHGVEQTARFARIIAQIAEGIAASTCKVDGRQQFRVFAGERLKRSAEILALRAQHGFVRRCHGDLHLDNIVMWKGQPTLFDAIEFDEDLATIDTLYDLAFLLMDLEAHGARAVANQVLNRYLWRSGADLDVQGLAALPLFLALRSAIRAMVGLQRAALSTDGTVKSRDCAASACLAAALLYLQPPAPMLLAIGGFSGTGKSTLAAALAPLVGAAPGAVHLRSDLERKSMFGSGETERLESTAYSAAATTKVYATLTMKAQMTLHAKHAVIVDAVFSKPDERAEIEEVARRESVPFRGLWLEAPHDEMARRVAERAGDASDATPAVVRTQIDRGAGDITWARIDAGGSPESALADARRALGI